MIYVVQNVCRKTHSGAIVPVHDITSAEEFGEVVHLLGPTTMPFEPEKVISVLRDKLQDFGEDDYLLPIGNPLFIGWATALANHYSDTVKMLYWNRKKKAYSVIDSDLTYLDQ